MTLCLEDYLVGVFAGVSGTCWLTEKYDAAIFFAVAEALLFAGRMGLS